MDIKDYHAQSALGSSTIREILKSTAHYEYRLNNHLKKTDAMILGDAIHAYILEPDRFSSMYEKVNDVYKRAVGNNKVGDPKLDEDGQPIVYLMDKNGEGLDIGGENYKKFQAMTKAIDNSDLVKSILKDVDHIEFSIFGKLLGLDIKCRPDAMSVKKGIIWDVKTVGGMNDKPSDNFVRDFIEMGYDVQCALYKKLCDEKFGIDFEFRFLCIDAKKDVCGIKEWIVSDELIELGQRRLKYCLEEISKLNKGQKTTVYDCDSEILNPDYKCLEMLEKYRGEK